GRLERPLDVPPELGPLAPILSRAGQTDPNLRPDAMALGAAFHNLSGTLPSPEPLTLAVAAVFDDTEAVMDRDPTEVGWAHESTVAVVASPEASPGDATAVMATSPAPVSETHQLPARAVSE